MSSTELATLRNLSEGRAALERARAQGEIREIKRIQDIASAAKRFAEAQHLSEDAKRFAAEMELDAKRYLGEVLKQQEKNKGAAAPRNAVPSGNHVPLKLSDLGLSKKQSHEAQKLADIPEDDYAAFKAGAKSDTLNTKRALRVAREKEAERKRATASADIVVLPSGVEVREGDLRTALDDLAGEVDAIITDPPYPKEFLPEFDALGELAARLLKPSGVLVAMVGQMHLPAYIDRLSAHLPYRWCGAFLVEGPAAAIHPRKVRTKWKPLLIFGSPQKFIPDDLFAGDGDDKRFHHWGQSVAGFVQIVERLTEPGALVVDPFLGGGTTAVACLEVGSRRFVGCDVDAGAVRTTEERLADVA